MKFVNDNALNYLVQKINSIFRVDEHNNIRHDNLDVRKLDAQKIDINGTTRIETTDSGVIKLGNTLTDIRNTNTSVLSISGDEVTVKHSLDSYNITAHWISSHKGLILSSFSESDADLLTNGYPHLKLESSRIVISGDGNKSGSEYNSSYITVDSNDSKIKLTSDLLSVHSGDIVIHNKLTINDYLNVHTTDDTWFKVHSGGISMSISDYYSDDSTLRGQKIRLSESGNITLCGSDWIRMGISQQGTPATTLYVYETIMAHYGDDYRWLHLTCPNSNISLQLETDKAYYRKTNATRTANDEIAIKGDVYSIAEDINYNLFVLTLDDIKRINTTGTWSDNVYTVNNVTFTVNTSDNYVTSITANGTAQSQAQLQFPYISNLGNVNVSGCPQGGTSSTYYITTYTDHWTDQYDYGDGVLINNTTNELILIIIKSGYTANNLVFQPMVTKPFYKGMPFKLNTSNVAVDNFENTSGSWCNITFMPQNLSAATLKKNDGLILYTQNGTSSAKGNSYLIIGNDKSGVTSGNLTITDGNKTGVIRLYGQGTAYTQISTKVLETNRNIYFPDKEGTLVITDDLKATETNNDNGGWYHLPFILNPTNPGYGYNDGIRIYSKQGKKKVNDTTTQGQTYLQLGNNISIDDTTNDGNKTGVLRLYGKYTAYADILTPDNLTANTQYKLPTIANVSNGYTIAVNHPDMVVVSKPNASGYTFNQVASFGNSMGMVNLTASATANVNYSTTASGWHHFIQMSYLIQNQTTNMYQTQIVNKAGTNDLWVRSRSGGSVVDGTAWTANWTRILTESNYSSICNYIPNAGNTTTGGLTLSRSGSITIESPSYGSTATIQVSANSTNTSLYNKINLSSDGILIENSNGVFADIGYGDTDILELRNDSGCSIYLGTNSDYSDLLIESENSVNISSTSGGTLDFTTSDSGISITSTDLTLYQTDSSVFIDYDGVKLQGDETYTFIDVGHSATDYITISANTEAYYVKGGASATANDEIATIGYVTSRIQESDAMQYKGSINASADLPTVSNTTNNVKVGATYKVATAGNYSYYNGTATVTQACKVGDFFIAQAVASGTTKTITWDYIPSADDVLSLSYITSGTPTISTTAQTGTSITLGSVVTKMAETTLTSNANNVPTSSAVMTYFGNYIPNVGNTLSDVNTIITRTKTTGTEVGEDVDIQTGKLTIQPNKVELYLDNDCTYDSEGNQTGYMTISAASAQLYSKYGSSISRLALNTSTSSQLVSQESLLIESTDGNITLQSDDLIIKTASTAYYTHSSTVTDNDEIAVKGDILQIAEDIDYNLYKATIDELKTWNSTGTWTIDSSTSDYVYYDYAISNGHYLIIADANTNYVVSILDNGSPNVDTEIIIYNKKLPEIPKVSLNSHFSNSGSESTYYTKIVYNGQTYKDYGNGQTITTVTNQIAVISCIIKANSIFDAAPVLSKPIYKDLPYKTPQPTVADLQTQINDLINKLNNLS